MAHDFTDSDGIILSLNNMITTSTAKKNAAPHINKRQGVFNGALCIIGAIPSPFDKVKAFPPGTDIDFQSSKLRKSDSCRPKFNAISTLSFPPLPTNQKYPEYWG
jgi:hypothetical protein